LTAFKLSNIFVVQNTFLNVQLKFAGTKKHILVHNRSDTRTYTMVQYWE